MKQTDKAFWITVIPAVILWNLLCPHVTRMAVGGGSNQEQTTVLADRLMASNLLLSCALAVAAGYLAAVMGSPRCMRAASNVAVGVVIAFGLQNIIEYRAAELPLWYFGALPVTSAVSATIGGLLRALQRRGREKA